MSKKYHLCDWDRKDIEKNMAALLQLVSSPKYICKRCARVANSNDVLCKPVKIKKRLLGKTAKKSVL